MKKLLPLLVISAPLFAAQPPQYWPPRWPTPWHAGQMQPPMPVQPAPAENDGAAAAEKSEPASEDSGKEIEQARTGGEREYRDALHYMRQGDYAKAYCLWAPLAEEGHAEAQFSLGWMYHNGYGLNIDNRKAVEWWQAAAEGGLASAAFALGMLYSQGDESLGTDLGKAVNYYRQAAAAGNEEAVAFLRQLFVQHSQEMAEISAQWGEEEWELVEGGLLRVKVPRANVRDGPSTSHTLLDTLEQGATLVELFEQGEWIRARRPEGRQLVWIYSPLVEPAKPEGM